MFCLCDPAGPKVYIEGQLDHTLRLPSINTSITFNVLVYSTSPVSTFNIERTDGVTTRVGNLIVTDSDTHNPFSIVVRHRIEVPSVTDEITGTYTVTVVNEERESVTQNIDIIRATGIKVLSCVHVCMYVCKLNDTLIIVCTTT